MGNLILTYACIMLTIGAAGIVLTLTFRRKRKGPQDETVVDLTKRARKQNESVVDLVKREKLAR